MMARLGKKIIDNLQLKIMNVHVRFEEGNKYGSYSWGLTLQEINLTTTDSTWKPSFIERTHDSRDKLFKMLQVNKLNLYWESGTNGKLILLKEKEHSNEVRKARLAEMIREVKDVVLSITSEFKLTINPEDDLESPLYELDVGLDPIKFELQRLQLQQMMEFARKNVLQNEMIVKSINKKSRNKLSEEEKCRLKEEFEDFITASIEIQQSTSGASSTE
jgi:vacuolar protein sorting-associated protein 13A/C